MNSPDISKLVQTLDSQDSRQAAQAADQLTAMGPSAAPQLLDALGAWNGLMALANPFVRFVEQPGKLKYPSGDRRKQCIEDVLYNLGPAALPILEQEFGRPNLFVRQSIARVLARHGAAAIQPLLAALRQPGRRYLAGDALALVGQPAVQPLVDLLHGEPLGSATWNAADAALCGIAQAPTRKATRGLRRFLFAVSIGALAVAALLFGIGMWAGIGVVASLILGLVGGYVCWGALLEGQLLDAQHTYSGWTGAVFFVIDMLSAPFTFRAKVAKYKSMAADREKLKQTYGLPG